MTENWKAGHWFAWVLWGMIDAAVTMAILTAPDIGNVGIAAIIIGAIAIWLLPVALSEFNW